MKTQIHISKTGTEAIVIDVIDDESVHVDVHTDPNQFMPEPTAPTFAVTGLRWRDGKHYHLAWVNRPLNLGDSILIESRRNGGHCRIASRRRQATTEYCRS
jgi:hypothetical protein